MTWKRRPIFAVAMTGLLIAVLLAACGGSSSKNDVTATPAGNASPSAAVPLTPTGAAGGSTTTATTSVRSTATDTSTPTFTATATSPAGTGEAAYVDDRSDPAVAIRSFCSAINRHEYPRAYSYWRPSLVETEVGSFDDFAQGYAGTAQVAVTFGTITGDVGAGQIYYDVPVLLHATATDGSTQSFAGCYRLHLGRPQIQSVPPFEPLAIEHADVREVSSGDPAALLAGACPEPLGQPVQTPPATVTTIDDSVYIDNRSTPEDVLRSLYNAVNRREYVRAYSYWEQGAQDLAPYEQFAEGYAQTASVELTTGAATVGAAAGNLYYSVPATVIAHTSDGSTQTFVGCYTLHLGQPASHATPPFQPMAIQSAMLEQVENDADTEALMATACAQ